MDLKNFITIVIPCKNENQTVDKTLSDMQIMTITNAMLRNNKTEIEIAERLNAETKKINTPKKKSFWNSFDEENESGIM